MKHILILFGWLLLASCTQAQTNEVPSLPTGYLYKVEPGVPGKQVYICGEHPFNQNGQLVAAGDLSGQTRQVFENIKTALATVSMTLQDVTQVTYSIKGTSVKVSADTAQLLTNLGKVYFVEPPKLMEVKSIPKIMRDDVLIQVEVIAMK